jgi:hypothetical protein
LAKAWVEAVLFRALLKTWRGPFGRGDPRRLRAVRSPPLVWCGFLWRLQWRAPIIAILFAGVVAIDALRPFQFGAVAHRFGWIPVAGFMRGSVEVNVRSFFEKVFTYGTLTWLIARAGSKFIIAVCVSTGLVLCLRLSQVFLPGRSAEIIDPIMPFIVAGVIKSTGENPARVEAVVDQRG